MQLTSVYMVQRLYLKLCILAFHSILFPRFPPLQSGPRFSSPAFLVPPPMQRRLCNERLAGELVKQELKRNKNEKNRDKPKSVGTFGS